MTGLATSGPAVHQVTESNHAVNRPLDRRTARLKSFTPVSPGLRYALLRNRKAQPRLGSVKELTKQRCDCSGRLKNKTQHLGWDTFGDGLYSGFPVSSTLFPL